MNRIFNLILGMSIAFSATGAFGQNSSTQANGNISAAAKTPAVAYVYVASNYSGSSNRIEAFATAPDGRLTRIAGSPFQADVSGMAVNGNYLFGAGTNGVDIYSFGILRNGGLKRVATTNAQTYNATGCPGLGPLVLDHTGADLYVSVLEGGLCDSSEYQSFSVQKPTGKLTYLGSTAETFLFNHPLTFIGNNISAYGTDCINYQGSYLDTFAEFQRLSNGKLIDRSISAPTPGTQDSSYFYCRGFTVADRTTHLAVAVQAIDVASGTSVGSTQLATFTAGQHGNLYTASNYKNMPATEVGYLSDMSMAPSGKLLAVGGSAGLQIFHFNQDGPITHYTGLITKDAISQVAPAPGLMFWDNANHLYAISPGAGKLFVFTVTATSVKQAPGSPYTILSPQNLIVQPLTK